MDKQMLHYINNQILKQAKNLVYTVKDYAPSTEQGLFNESSLIIWSGGSDTSIYQDASVNWAFRAIHDQLHLDTGIGFDPAMEMYLGRLQASKQSSDLMRELVYSEVVLQAEYYLNTGNFVSNQESFTLNNLKIAKVL